MYSTVTTTTPFDFLCSQLLTPFRVARLYKFTVAWNHLIFFAVCFFLHSLYLRIYFLELAMAEFKYWLLTGSRYPIGSRRTGFCFLCLTSSYSQPSRVDSSRVEGNRTAGEK